MQTTVQKLLRELLDYLEATSLGHRDTSNEFESTIPLTALEQFQADLMRARIPGQEVLITSEFSPRSLLAEMVFRRSGLTIERFVQVDAITDTEIERMVNALEGLRGFHQITAQVCEG
jgi:hypothetical protein